MISVRRSEVKENHACILEGDPSLHFESVTHEAALKGSFTALTIHAKARLYGTGTVSEYHFLVRRMSQLF